MVHIYSNLKRGIALLLSLIVICAFALPTLAVESVTADNISITIKPPLKNVAANEKVTIPVYFQFDRDVDVLTMHIAFKKSKFKTPATNEMAFKNTIKIASDLDTTSFEPEYDEDYNQVPIVASQPGVLGYVLKKVYDTSIYNVRALAPGDIGVTTVSDYHIVGLNITSGAVSSKGGVGAALNTAGKKVHVFDVVLTASAANEIVAGDIGWALATSAVGKNNQVQWSTASQNTEDFKQHWIIDVPKVADNITTPADVTGIKLGTAQTALQTDANCADGVDAGKLPGQVKVNWTDGSSDWVDVTWDFANAKDAASGGNAKPYPAKDAKAGDYYIPIKTITAGDNTIDPSKYADIRLKVTVNTSTIASVNVAAGNNAQKYYVGALPTEANAKALFSKASNIGITPTAATYAGSNLIARDLTWTGTYNQSAAAGTTMTFTGSYTKVGNTADLYTVGTSGDFTNTDKTISATIEVVAKQNLLKDVVKPGVTAADLGLVIGASQADVEAKLNALTGKQTITKAGGFYADVTGITSAMPASYTVKETGTWTLAAGQTWSSAAQSTMKFEKTIAEADIEKVGTNDVVSIVPNNHKMTVEVTFGGHEYTGPMDFNYGTVPYGTTEDAVKALLDAWKQEVTATDNAKGNLSGTGWTCTATFDPTVKGKVYAFEGTPAFSGGLYRNGTDKLVLRVIIGNPNEITVPDIELEVPYMATKAEIQAMVADTLDTGITVGNKVVKLKDAKPTTDTDIDTLVGIAGQKMESVLADINKMIYDISGANAAAATPVKYKYTFTAIDKAKLVIMTTGDTPAVATDSSLAADPVVKVTFKPERKLFTVGDISLDTTNSKVAFKLTAKDAADTDQTLPTEKKLIAVATISENGKLVGVVKTVIEGLDTVNAEGYTIDVPSTLTLKDGMTAKVVMINEFGDGKSAVGTVFSSEN